jgi:hypothetical protein
MSPLFPECFDSFRKRMGNSRKAGWGKTILEKKRTNGKIIETGVDIVS